MSEGRELVSQGTVVGAVQCLRHRLADPVLPESVG